ncbi:hypothetical protein ACQKMD_19190 [Viridibacillus sp. NPDC096237]|uniref:hypothetical protein n=1 Tax=Viridibacillus sp. NPDC096237 TaxID=3390721 RepID=UPI003D05E711
MKTWKIVLMILMTLMIVSACGKDDKMSKTKEIKIPDTEDYQSLYVQGVNEEGVGTDTTRKTITDKEIIQSFIQKVNLMEVIKPKSDKDTANVKELHNQGNYIIALSKSADVTGKTYKLYVLKDGTVFFQDPVKKEMTYISAKKNTALYKEVKELLGIEF